MSNAGALEASPLGPCPGCGAQLFSSAAPDPRFGNEVTSSLIHPIPFCSYFGETEIDAIVTRMLEIGLAEVGKVTA